MCFKQALASENNIHDKNAYIINYRNHIRLDSRKNHGRKKGRLHKNHRNWNRRLLCWRRNHVVSGILCVWFSCQYYGICFGGVHFLIHWEEDF